ncbi:MAG TPA: hypothetical protein VFK02_13625 [Kofleriaceae bacterium]|nr:hypothetical protein [Kofleriaceae bacterium]
MGSFVEANWRVRADQDSSRRDERGVSWHAPIRCVRRVRLSSTLSYGACDSVLRPPSGTHEIGIRVDILV